MFRVPEGDEELLAFDLVVDDDAFLPPPLDVPEVVALAVQLEGEVVEPAVLAVVHGGVAGSLFRLGLLEDQSSGLGRLLLVVLLIQEGVGDLFRAQLGGLDPLGFCGGVEHQLLGQCWVGCIPPLLALVPSLFGRRQRLSLPSEGRTGR